MNVQMLVLFSVVATLASANCGCLKCCKDLHVVNSPQNQGMKIIFRGCNNQCPPCPTTDCGGAALPFSVQAPLPSLPKVNLPGRSYNYKLQPLIVCPPTCGCQYQASGCDNGGAEYKFKVEAPLPSLPKINLPLWTNLKYRTDRVVVPAPPCACECPCGPKVPVPQQPEIPSELISTLVQSIKNALTSSTTQNVAQTLVQPLRTPKGPTFERLPPPCGRDYSEERYSNLYENLSHVTNCYCNNNNCNKNLKCKRYASTNSENSRSRKKRDVDFMKHGYKFFVNMLPPYFRDPLKDTLTAMVHSQGPYKKSIFKPPPTFKEKIEERNRKFQEKLRVNLHKTTEQYKNGKNSRPLFEPNAKKPVNKNYFAFNDNTQQKYNNYLPTSNDPFLEQNYKKFIKSAKLNKPSQNYHLPKFYSRMPEKSEETQSEFVTSSTDVDKALLTKKLKMLTGKHTASNLGPLKEAFLQKLYETPEKRHTRSIDDAENKISNNDKENKMRNKRTIILGSDEVDLPYYEVTHSEEDSFEDIYDDNVEQITEQTSEEYEEYEDDVEEKNLIRKSVLEPDIIVGKNIIEKAVQKELSKYHEAMQHEQRLNKARKESKLADPFQLNSIIPHNPIFMLLTAPMKLLRNFHDFNKGLNPIATSLPKLLYTTKKYFRDFGKNFQKNCLNLASDLIGDFDNVQPSIISQIVQPGRYKRDLAENEEIVSFNKTIIDEKCDVNKSKSAVEQYEPDYSLVFDSNNSEEDESVTETRQNFRKVSEENVRKKRYIVQVVDEDHVEDYLTQKLQDDFEYLEPLKEYYNKVNDVLLQLTQNYRPLAVQNSQEQYYTRHEPIFSQETEEKYDEKPKRRRLKVKKVKPRVIIDNNGIPFMEYNGYKRPLSLHKKSKRGSVMMRSRDSSEEIKDKIVGLIQKAKEQSEVVGSTPDFMPKQIIKEKISFLLKDTDNLVHLDTETYDHIFDELLRLQHIKTSIVQDWKRILMNNQVDDIQRKITLLDKMKDLQHTKDILVRNIADELKCNCGNLFVRKKLIGTLVRLHKLQCIITGVVNDFEEHLNMGTQFNTKKEIKYVDFLSGLNFANGRTRNDLVGTLKNQRDIETHKNIEMLNKLKKVLIVEDSGKIEDVGKLVWETKNLEKLQDDTIKELNKKMIRNGKVKKEMKILFDLQKRHETCNSELEELLNLKDEKTTNMVNKKKDVKEVLEEIKRKHEEFREKIMEKNRIKLEMMQNK